MSLRSLLEPRNTVEESLDKRYELGPLHAVVELGQGDAEPYYLRDRGTLGESILFDFLGTMPDPKLAARFAEQFVSQRCDVGSIVTGSEIFDWLEADCVVEHEPDGSAGFCTVAESEGLAIRRLRRR